MRPVATWMGVVLRAETRFERIYAAGYELVMAYALRRTATPEDAADVVAETFLTAWRRLDRVPDPPESRLWLYATARRVLANQLRGQRRWQRLAAKLREAVPDSPGGAPADRDTALIAAAFGRLKPVDREVLTLAGWEGLDAGEIAGVLGCGAGTARVRLHRARRRFADELAAAGVPVPSTRNAAHRLDMNRMTTPDTGGSDDRAS